jgi:hypothetical protein
MFAWQFLIEILKIIRLDRGMSLAYLTVQHPRSAGKSMAERNSTMKTKATNLFWMGVDVAARIGANHALVTLASRALGIAVMLFAGAALAAEPGIYVAGAPAASSQIINSPRH